VVGVGVLDDGDDFVAAGNDGGTGGGGLVEGQLGGCGKGEERRRGLTWGISCWRRSGGVRGL